MSSTDVATVKKFLNNPDDLVPESLAGLEAAHSDLLIRSISRIRSSSAREPRSSGKVALVSGGGERARAAARRLRRDRHARRRLPGRGLHLARARSDARRDEGRRRRRGRRPHRQELHRRRAELPACRGRAGRGRGDPGRVGAHERRRRRRGQPLHGRPPRRRRRPSSSRRSPARRPRRAARSPRSPRIARKVNAQGAELRRRADVVRHARRRTARSSRSAPTRWSSASASTASPAGGANASSRRRRSSSEMTTAILSDLDPPSGSNVLAFVNGLGGTPLIELYVVYNELTKQLERARPDRDAEPRRQLHHEPRDGRRVDHVARARRRADRAVGCSGAHSRAALGRLAGWTKERAWMPVR